MYASSVHSSSTQSSLEFAPSPALSCFSRPITSCLPCRTRKVKCDRRQPQCLVCERGDYACSYVSKPQSPGTAPESSRISKSSSASRISSSNLARINPALQRLGNFMAQARASVPSDPCPASLDSFTPTRSTPAPHNVPTPQPRSHEDALILDNGVPLFISGKHWAWMAAEVRFPISIKFARSCKGREILSKLASRHPIGSRGISDILPRGKPRRCHLERSFSSG